MAAPIDDFVEEMRLLAMKAVERPDGEYFIRKVCRWYSNTFSTPLHVVERDIPIEDLMRHYFEWKYERMEEEERAHELDDLLLTPAERKAREEKMKVEAEDDLAFLEQTKRDLEAAKEKDPELNLPFKHGLPQMPLAPVMGSSIPLHPAANATPDALKQIPPDIHMEFVSDLDSEIDKWDLMGTSTDEDKGSK